MEAPNDAVSTQGISESPSRVISTPHKSNYAVNFDLSTYPQNLHLMVTALQFSKLSKAMSISCEVPLSLVSEAVDSFHKINDNSFSFKLLGVSRKILKSKFIETLHLSRTGDVKTPSSRELFEMVNQMGHQPAIAKVSEFVQSRLPDEWSLLYAAVVYSICGKTTGRGKMNANQLLVMYSLYYDVNVNVGDIVYDEFINICGLKKVGEIVFHRYWSVLVAEVLKKADPDPARDALPKMEIFVMPLPGPKKYAVKFDYVGQLPESMLLCIPAGNNVKKAFEEQDSTFVSRVYDLCIFDQVKRPSKGSKRKEPSGTQKKAKTKRAKKVVKPTLQDKGSEEDELSQPGSNHESDGAEETQSEDHVENIGTLPTLNQDNFIYEGEMEASISDQDEFQNEKVVAPLFTDFVSSSSSESTSEDSFNACMPDIVTRGDLTNARRKLEKKIKKVRSGVPQLNEKIDALAKSVTDLVLLVKERDDAKEGKIKRLFDVIEEKFNESHHANIAKLKEFYETKHENLEKEFETRMGLLDARFKKETEILNAKVNLAQRREDALAKDVKELKELVSSIKPCVEKVSGDGLKELISAHIVDQFGEQRVHLETKISESLLPLRNLSIIAEKWQENEQKKMLGSKGVAGARTGQQGGEKGKRTVNVNVPIFTAGTTQIFNMTTGSMSSANAQVMDDILGTSIFPFPTPKYTDATPISSVPLASNVSHMTQERKKEIIKGMVESTLILSLGDQSPKLEEVEPLIAKMEIMMNQANAKSKFFEIKPYSSIISKPGLSRDFDFGLNPRAVLFPVYAAPEGDFEKSREDENRLLMWYASQSKGIDEVWSTHRIIKCKKVFGLPAFQGIIKNVCFTIERSNSEVSTFTLADLPWVNLGDVITLIKMWKRNNIEGFVWLSNYLKRYLELFFVDFSYQDFELAKITKIKTPLPHHEYTEANKKRTNGEIIPDGSSFVIYYEIDKGVKGVVQRIMRLSELSLFPTNTILEVMELVRASKNKSKFKRTVFEKVEWLIEFRKRMLQLPQQFFPHMVEKVKPKDTSGASGSGTASGRSGAERIEEPQT